MTGKPRNPAVICPAHPKLLKIQIGVFIFEGNAQRDFKSLILHSRFHLINLPMNSRRQVRPFPAGSLHRRAFVLHRLVLSEAR